MNKTIGRPYPKAWIIGKTLTKDGTRFKTHGPRMATRNVQGHTGPLDDVSEDGSGGVAGSAA